MQAPITLARGLGRDCIAEGVETEGQRQMLQELGCDLYQGYLFSRPLPAAGFAARFLGGAAAGPPAAALSRVRGRGNASRAPGPRGLQETSGRPADAG